MKEEEPKQTQSAAMGSVYRQVCLFWLFALWVLVLPAAVQAQEFIYQEYDGTITITGYAGPGGAVVIPTMLDGLPVTSITEMAFSGASNVTSISIPDSVVSIGTSAFAPCASLTNITLGGGVHSIGSAAFEAGTNLVAITVQPSNPNYSSLDGALFNKDQTTLVLFPQGRAGSYNIPGTVTSIGHRAFAGCVNLATVTIPESISSIGGAAFAWCSGLTSITIPNSVTNISGIGAFYHCTGLTSVTIGSGVADIAMLTFKECASLTNMTIPDSVISIGVLAFLKCSNLNTITIGKGVTSIGDGAFDYCPGLETISVNPSNLFYRSLDGVLFNKDRTTLIRFPEHKAGSSTILDGVASIGNGAFRSCTNLTGVAIPNSVTNIGRWAFRECTSLIEIVIPGSITSINEEAFIWCSSLTNVAVGDGVTEIGRGAFCACTALNGLTIPSSVTLIGDWAFSACTNLKQVYFRGAAPRTGFCVFCQSEAIMYYLPGAASWGATFEGRPTVPWVLPQPVTLKHSPGFGVQNNAFGFIISWATNVPVVVEACTDLVSPTWSPLSTNTLTDGWSYFSDPQWANYPARFYRLRSP